MSNIVIARSFRLNRTLENQEQLDIAEDSAKIWAPNSIILVFLLGCKPGKGRDLNLRGFHYKTYLRRMRKVEINTQSALLQTLGPVEVVVSG